jgi:hypothetical protein
MYDVPRRLHRVDLVMRPMDPYPAALTAHDDALVFPVAGERGGIEVQRELAEPSAVALGQLLQVR